MNTDDASPLKIPLEFDPNTEALERLIQRAQEADTEIQKLEQSLVRAANAMNVQGPAGAFTFSSAAEVRSFVGQAGGTQAIPELASIFRRMEDREKSIADAIKAGQQRPGAAPTAQPLGSGGPSFGERLAQNAANTRTLAGLGALAMGDPAPLGRTMAYSFMQTLASTPLPGRGGGGSGGGGSFLGTLAGAIGGGGGGGGALSTAGAAEAGAADVAAGTTTKTLGSVLGEALTSPVGAIIATATAALGAGLYRDKLRAQARTEEVALGSNVGGLGYVSMGDAYSRALSAGHAMMVAPEVALSTASQLGQAGVQGPALLGQGNAPGALATTLGFAKATGLDPAQVAQLTAGLMVQGKQSVDQVAAVFQALQDQATKTQVPVGRLVDSLQTLQAATGGAGLSLRGAEGLAAAQSTLGTAVNAGSVLGPSMGAFGTDATRLAGMLRMTPDQFARIQQDPAQMLDAISGFAKTFTGGRRDQGTLNALETVMQQSGMLNLQGMSPQARQQAITTLLSQAPGATQRLAAQLQASGQLQGAAGYNAQQAALAQTLAGPDVAAQLNLEYAKRALGTPSPPADPTLQPRPGGWGRLPRTAPGAPIGGPAVPGGPPTPAGPLNRPRTTPFYWDGYTVNNLVYNQYLAASKRYGVPMELLLSQAAAESSFNPQAVSGAGAAGLAQLTPALISDLQTGRGIYSDSPFKGQSLNPYYTANATSAQAYLMSKYLRLEGGNVTQALYDYQAGPGRTRMGPPLPDTSAYAQTVQGLEVKLSGTLTVQDSKGNRIGTAQIAPQTVTVDPHRQPRGGAKGAGPAPRPVPMPQRGHR